MSPLEQLGLPEDADERMVKQAYAKRLKDARPDGDPEAFQQLHSIYQQALQQCREASCVHAPRVATQPPLPVTDTVSTSSPANVVTLQFDPFYSQVLTLAGNGKAEQLGAWLAEQPDLWSLQLKSRIGHRLFNQFHADTPPMPAACIEILLTFFDMNQSRTDHDALHLQRLLRRMQLSWELQPAHRNELAARMGVRSSSERNELDINIQRLTRPLQWMQVARIGLLPNEAPYYVQFIQQMSLEHPEDLPEPFDQNQIRFWLKATDLGHLGEERLQLAALRCAAALLAGVLLGLLPGMLLHTPSERFGWTAFWWCFGVPVLPYMLWATFLLVVAVDRWQGVPERLPVRWPWLNLLLVPMLCTTASGLAEAGSPVMALVVAIVALWLAFRRLRHRSGTLFRFSSRQIWFGFWALLMLVRSLLASTGHELESSVYPALAIALALLVWGADLWRQRHRLRVGLPGFRLPR
ncbi:MAG TPA: hypothetical protein VN043_00105 [Rhodanobacter sp.]|jgi:hypothetical protein|nr:hypothetical protein [Rhodanobacter sp.]